MHRSERMYINVRNEINADSDKVLLRLVDNPSRAHQDSNDESTKHHSQKLLLVICNDVCIFVTLTCHSAFWNEGEESTCSQCFFAGSGSCRARVLAYGGKEASPVPQC